MSVQESPKMRHPIVQSLRAVVAAPLLALAACLACPVAAKPARAASSELHLYVGQAHVLDEPEVRRIVIGNGKVIQATALDDRQVLIIPEAPGQSTLHLWGRDGRERELVVTVTPADAGRLLGEIRAMLVGSPNLIARIVGDKVVIEGGNLTEEQAARLAEVGRRFPQVVNLASRLGLERMIAIDVRMVEIRREALENIGVRWSPTAAGPTFGLMGDLHRSNEFRPGGAAESVPGMDVRPRVSPFATVFGIATTITSMINLLVQNGDAVVLAEPSLSCRSGGSARFIAGGELPIPYSGGLATVSVVFKEYGVKFDIHPVASETGVIAAKVATEVSAINFDIQVKDVPGLTKRRAETDVNLREHETLVIAGLLTEETARNVDRVPALGELPVLGNLFRSRAFRDRKSELVVFVTPRFVEPLGPAPQATRVPAGPLLPAVPAGASAAPAAPGDLAPPEPAPVRTDPPFGVPRLEPGNYRERTQQARERVRIIE
jgi:pilus assembly protein CpaC